MSNYAISLKRTGLLLAALAFTALLLVVNFASFFSKASAEQLTARSLTLSSTLPGSAEDTTPGTHLNGEEAIHTFSFTTGPDGSDAVAIRLLYCTTAVGTCNTPVGLDTTNATLTDQSGVSNLVVDSVAVNGTIDLDTGTFGDSTATTIEISGVTNPTTVATFFVRMVTYSDNFSTAVDDGTVASAITTGIAITSRVAETLGFSVSGALTDGAGGDTDPGTGCDPLTGSGAITIGDPTANTLAINTTYDNYTGFRVFTNAAGETLIQYEGDTLRRGGTVDINPIGGIATQSTHATEQFGLAVDLVNGGTASVAIASSATARDLSYYQQESGGAGDGDLDGGAGAGGITVDPEYVGGAGSIINGGTAEFAFVGDADVAIEPQTIAEGNGYISCASAAVRYIANIHPTTPAGTYTTTIVYSAVPTY